MHVEYGLDLKGMLPTFKRWHAADQPNAQERSLNTRIELQGIRNQFISINRTGFSSNEFAKRMDTFLSWICCSASRLPSCSFHDD